MFVCCLLSGIGARWVFDAQPGTVSTQESGLVVHVRSGQRALHVRNLTDLDWTGCVATIEGGAISPPFTLDAGRSARVPMEHFHRADRPTDPKRPGEGTLRTTAVVCRGAGGAPHLASLR